MSSVYQHQPLKRTHNRTRRRRASNHCVTKPSSKLKQPPSLIARLRQVLFDLRQQPDLFHSFTALELICQQVALSQMSTVTETVASCPFLCLFCENLIYEPVTLYCGHTFCEACIAGDEPSSLVNCPRCSKDIQGQIQSPVAHAREQAYSKNHLLKQILERSETLQSKCVNSSLCYQAQKELAGKNYQKALDIYSTILDNYDDHLAYFGRAKAYFALKEYDQGLTDMERVVQLKPQWAKGFYHRSEMLFEMKRSTAALLSSLQGLALDPEDPIGKQIMARHLHTVLCDKDDKESALEMENESKRMSSKIVHTKEIVASRSSNTKLVRCRSSNSASCLCNWFDGKHLRARDFECSICVNFFWFPVTTPCGHIFCRECLIRSIDNTQAQCPMCKGSLEQFFPMLIQSHVNKTEIVAQMIETFFPNEFDERRQLHEVENIEGASIPRTLATDAESIIFEIPIFVCVLALPHSTCPLHVFEPRYRLMMRRTIETDSRTFGMCKYDEQTDTFADYGTLLYIRGHIYTQDGRSVVDTIGQRRFRVFERDERDSYCTARVQLIRDLPIEQEEFDDLYQLNRSTYQRVRDWFDQLDAYRRTLISRQLESYPICDDLAQGSADGPSWAWIMLNVLPIESDLQYTVLTSQSFRTRLQMIHDTIDFLLNNHQQQQQQQHQQQPLPLPQEAEQAEGAIPVSAADP